jgi:hypothetical protein
LHPFAVFRQELVRPVERLLNADAQRVVGCQILYEPVNFDDEPLRILYQCVFDFARQSGALT